MPETTFSQIPDNSTHNLHRRARNAAISQNPSAGANPRD